MWAGPLSLAFFFASRGFLHGVASRLSLVDRALARDRAYADARLYQIDVLERLCRRAARNCVERNRPTLADEHSDVDVRSGTHSAFRPHASGLLPTRSRSDFAQGGLSINPIGGITLSNRVITHGQDAAGTGSVR